MLRRVDPEALELRKDKVSVGLCVEEDTCWLCVEEDTCVSRRILVCGGGYLCVSVGLCPSVPTPVLLSSKPSVLVTLEVNADNGL
jgi:hypothetical protein